MKLKGRSTSVAGEPGIRVLAGELTLEDCTSEGGRGGLDVANPACQPCAGPGGVGIDAAGGAVRCREGAVTGHDTADAANTSDTAHATDTSDAANATYAANTAHATDTTNAADASNSCYSHCHTPSDLF